MLSFFPQSIIPWTNPAKDLSEIDSDHKLLITVTTQVTTYVTWYLSLNKGNFGLNGEKRGSLPEVFCTTNYKPCTWICSFNPIQNKGGDGGKRTPTSFSTVTSTNVGISPQNFLNFSFHAFATLVLNFKFAPSASPKLLNLNQNHPSNPYKIEVMTTFLIEMLELPNFGHKTKSTI